jgi:site-specific DNA recombinase
VKEVFDIYTTGAHSYLSIANKLTQKYPGVKLTKRKVESIIKNPYYYGYREFKGELYPHKYTTIISEEIYDLAVDVRKGRTVTKKKGKLLGQNGIYRGLIYCDGCGCAFSPDTNRHVKLGREVESESYYYCTNSKRKHTQKPKGTNDKELTKQFIQIFKKIQIPQEDLNSLTKSLRESHEGKKQFTATETSECNGQITRYQNMIENAYEDKCAGDITQEEYKKIRKKWRKKQEEFKKRLEKIMKADEEYYINASYLLELASRSQELFEGSEPAQKREIITQVLQNLRMKDGKLLYDWVEPFGSIFEFKKRHNWGG